MGQLANCLWVQLGPHGSLWKKNFWGSIFSAGLSNNQLLSIGKEKHADITEKLSGYFIWYTSSKEQKDYEHNKFGEDTVSHTISFSPNTFS